MLWCFIYIFSGMTHHRRYISILSYYKTYLAIRRNKQEYWASTVILWFREIPNILISLRAYIRQLVFYCNSLVLARQLFVNTV